MIEKVFVPVSPRNRRMFTCLECGKVNESVKCNCGWEPEGALPEERYEYKPVKVVREVHPIEDDELLF